MYHGSVERIGFESAGVFSFEASGTRMQIESLWNDVIRAWIPTKGEIEARGLEKSVAKCIASACRTFVDWTTVSDSADVYRYVNDQIPEGCPQRFDQYFERRNPGIH